MARLQELTEQQLTLWLHPTSPSGTRSCCWKNQTFKHHNETFFFFPTPSPEAAGLAQSRRGRLCSCTEPVLGQNQGQEVFYGQVTVSLSQKLLWPRTARVCHQPGKERWKILSKVSCKTKTPRKNSSFTCKKPLLTFLSTAGMSYRLIMKSEDSLSSSLISSSIGEVSRTWSERATGI